MTTILPLKKGAVQGEYHKKKSYCKNIKIDQALKREYKITNEKLD